MKELLQKIEENGLLIEVVDGKLKLYSDGSPIESEILNAIRTDKDKLTAYILENNLDAIHKNQYESIPLTNLGECYPISDAQHRLWILSQFEGVSVAYNTPGMISLNDSIDIECFKRAIEAVIERHEILRTVFKADASGEIRQWILNRAEIGFEIGYFDFRKEENKDEKIRAYTKSESDKPFDLENGPLLRACLLQLHDKSYVFYYNMHHIISDEWSMEVLSKDVLSFYEAYKRHNEPSLEELRIQYKDYSAWQLGQLEKESFKSHRSYWLENLKGNLPVLDLPFSKQRPRIKSYNGRVLNTYIDSATTAKLKKYSESNGGSVFMFLLASWNVLMYRYTCQKDIIMGTPVAGREHADLEAQIGLYVNTVVLRNELNPEDNFNILFSRVKQNTFHAYAHQSYPFDRIIEDLGLKRDISRSPVFDQSITYHSSSEATRSGKIDSILINAVSDMGVSKVKNDLELHFNESADCLSFHLVYNGDLYEKEMIVRLMNHYKRLLSALLERPSESISRIDYLSEEEKLDLLIMFNDTAIMYPQDKTIVDLFREQVAKTPDHIAIIFEKKELSYQELDALSNKLAHYIMEVHKLSSNDLVGIHLDRSEWVIISILGVLKAGAAYIPIDPEYPSSRKEYITKEASLKLLITEANYIHDLAYYTGSVFAIDVEFDSDRYSSKSPSIKIAPNNLAYVIYTSGSTGNPKGVMVEHQAILNTLLSQIEFLQVTSENKGLQFASFSFDASIWETFIILLSGGSLFIINEHDRKDPELLTDFIQKHKLDIATLPPSYLTKMDMNELKGLTKLITAGEAAVYEKALEYVEYGTYYNAYGPTETSICCTIFKLENRNSLILNSIPIGKPISNTQVYILNEEAELQPKGVIGEICIGGSGLARGYLNQEDLTQEKFIDNPFRSGERLYKTGDLGRWLADGNLEFLGRKDDQVKIRGYRIELGEIEYTLQRHSKIESAVVQTRVNQNGEKELVAYIISKSEQNANELRSYLKRHLPDYMLPTYYVQLENLPLTSNGKIDKKALPDPEGNNLLSGVEYAAPGNETEEQLVLIWQEVLAKDKIGIHDNFFEIGGNSISAIRLVSRLQQNYKVTVNDIFQHPTVATLAKTIFYTKDFLAKKIEAFAINYKNQPDIFSQNLENKDKKEAYLKQVKAYNKINLSDKKNYNHILITGSTGYLGAHILHQLLIKCDTRITVIVRDASKENAKNRLFSKLQYYFSDGIPSHNLNRIEVYQGDLTKDNFGVQNSEYQELVSCIDCIIHSAADVRHYGSINNFEDTNVAVVRQLIKLASNGTRKDIHHISTISVGSGWVANAQNILFSEYDHDVDQEVDNFYVKTKLAAEKLLVEARNKGACVNIYRMGNLVFDSRTGIFQENITDNAFYNKIKSFMQLGYIPRYENEFEFSCIDQASEAFVALFNRKNLENETFHIHNPNRLKIDDFQKYLSKSNYHVETIDAGDFAKYILENYDNNREVMDTILLQYNAFDNNETQYSNFEIVSDKSNLILKLLGFQWLEINEEHIRIMLSHCKKVDFITTEMEEFGKIKKHVPLKTKQIIKEMEYRRLGNSGLKLSALSLGSWLTFGNQISDDMAAKLMKMAYDNGINFFDNAEIYAQGRSETVMGNIIKKMGWSRDTFVISSKVFWGGPKPNQHGLSKKHVIEACHAALTRLQVEYLDLYLCHRPDEETPIEETVRAMHQLIQQGKVLYWGTSEWSTKQIMEAYTISRKYYLTPPILEQPQYNIFSRDKVELEFQPLYKEIGLGLTTWSPLYSGILTGKHNNSNEINQTRLKFPELTSVKEEIKGENGKVLLERVSQIGSIAHTLDMTLPEFAIGWCLKNKNVSTVLLGASRTEQLEQNLKAIERYNLLTDEILQKIDIIMGNNPNHLIKSENKSLVL